MKRLNNKILVLVAAGVLAALGSACGGNSDAAPTSDAVQMDMDMAAPAESIGGHLAMAEDADRTVKIVMSDKMTFDPDELDVKLGETITFDVVNEGMLPHELMVGNEASQLEHEEEMKDMGRHEHPNALLLDPGKKGSITWTFTDAGEVQMGCHVPGHYEAGMVGTINVR